MAKNTDDILSSLDRADPEEAAFLVGENETLDEKAFRRACVTTQANSVLVRLEDKKDIDRAVRSMQGFDRRVIAMVNRWSNSDHPEQVADMVMIGGRKASEVMRENGYSFMDCMMLAQHAIERNKPGVEFDVELSGEGERLKRRMNLSDPGFKNIPPSHMPQGLHKFLKVVTLGFFQNREERQNHKKEMEMIRYAAMEKERQSRLDALDESDYAREIRRKKEQNREMAEKGIRLQEEYELQKKDEAHGREGLERLDAYRQKASERTEQLARRKEQLLERAAANRKKLAELEKVTEATEHWLQDNPDWKKDPDKRKAFAGMLERVNTYHDARREHEQIGKSMAKVDRAAEKLMGFLGEMEGKRPRMTELYRKQVEHRLTEKERKELAELEKPQGRSQAEGKDKGVTRSRAARAEAIMRQRAAARASASERTKADSGISKAEELAEGKVQKVKETAEKTAKKTAEKAKHAARHR